MGPVVDANQDAIWGAMKWGVAAPYGLPVAAGDTNIIGLWHLDDAAAAAALDASGYGNDGVVNSATASAAGRFSTAFDFTAAGQNIQVPDVAALDPSLVSVSAWVELDSVSAMMVVDKRSGGNGYGLGVDANGLPFFQVNGVTATGPYAMRPGEWRHVAGTFDGSHVRVYVNGVVVGTAAFTYTRT